LAEVFKPFVTDDDKKGDWTRVSYASR